MSAEHAAFVAGLRELADWYEQHPEIPAPLYPHFHHGFLQGHEDDRPETVHRIAAALGSTVEVSPGGHIQTRWKFGPIDFLAPYIPDETMRAHRASQSYASNIQPDESDGAA